MAAFHFVLDAFKAIDVPVYGLSVDSIEDAEALVKRLGPELPLICDLKYPDDVDKIGACRHPARECHQATGFIIDAEHHVETSVYSTTNIGQLMPDEVLCFVT